MRFRQWHSSNAIDLGNETAGENHGTGRALEKCFINTSTPELIYIVLSGNEVYKEIVLTSQEAVCLVDCLQRSIKLSNPNEDIIKDDETKIFFSTETADLDKY